MIYTGRPEIDERIKEKIEAARRRQYFIVRSLNKCNELIPTVAEVVEAFKEALKPWYNTSWRNTWYAARYAPQDAVWDDVAMWSSWYAAWRAAYGAANDAGLDAAWEVVRDICGKIPLNILLKFMPWVFIQEDLWK
jgi:hypothetical protein